MEDKKMKKCSGKLSIILSLILVFQFFFPILNGFAAQQPGTPQNLKISLYNTNDIYLTWNAVSGADNYYVYRFSNDSKEKVAEAVNSNWWKPYAEKGMYTIAITSVKNGVESELSSTVSFEIVYPNIASPKDLTYSVTNVNDVQLKWSSVPYATSYKIYRLEDGKKIHFDTVTGTSRFLSGLPEGDYSYLVSAFNDRFGESFEDRRVDFTIAFPTITSPSGLTSTIYNKNDIFLVWKPVEFATSYNIYLIKDNKKELVSTTTDKSKYFSNLAEGEYIYEVSAVSTRFGESKNNSQTKSTIIFPKIDAPTGLTSTLYNNNDLYLVWNPVNLATKYNVYRINGNEKSLVISTPETRYYFSNLPEGEYVYEVSSVNDRFGESIKNNKTSDSIDYPILKAPDWLTSVLVGVNSVDLKWKASEYATSYKVFEVKDGQKTLVTTSNETKTRLEGLTEGDHLYEVIAVNNRFGESIDSIKTVVTIMYPEATAPEVKIQVDSSNNVLIIWEPVNYASSYNIFQKINGELVLLETIKSTSYNIYSLPEGIHEFAIIALSNYYGESPLSNIVKADIRPILDAPSTETPEIIGDKVELDWSPVPGADSYNIYKVEDGQITLVTNTQDSNITIEDLTPGNYEFRIVPVSPSGIEGEKYTTVIVEVEQTDTTPPQTVANESTDWLQVAFKVKLTATDDQSGVAKTFYSINGSEFTVGTSFTVTEEGINKVSFYSVDNAGNIEEVKTTEVKIDKTAPVTNSDITTNWNKGKVKVNLTATDNLSGVAKTFYSMDGSAYTEGNTFTISTEGITQVSFYSVDNAGNKEAAKIEEVMIDNTAPVTKSDITDQWNSDAVKVDLTATDNLSGVAKTYYSINGSEYLEGNSFTVTGEGVIQVSFYSVDNAGNEEAVKTEFVKLDNQAPETVSDVTDKWNTGDVTVNLTATDNESGVATTFYSINGSKFVEGTEITVNQEGINKVSFYSVDNVGNVEVVKTVDVMVDKTAPTTISDFTDKWNKDQVAAKLTATDELSGVAKTYYSINGTDYVEGTQFTVSQEGINKVSFYSVDNAGNIEDLQTVEVKVDKTAPVVSWNLADHYALGDSLPLAYKATDEHSGIAKETISVNGKVYENTDSVKLDKPGTYQIVVTVTDHAGWKTTLEKTTEVYIPATLIVNPGVIKANAGDFTVKISLPKGYNTNQIDLSTATLNGVSAKSGTNGLVQQAKNGQFKFNRDDFEWKIGMVTVEFRVLVDGILVIGSTTVEVK
jgi:large repetitive protein